MRRRYGSRALATSRWLMPMCVLCLRVLASRLAFAEESSAAPQDAATEQPDSTPKDISMPRPTTTVDASAREQLERDLSRSLAEPEFAYCRDLQRARLEVTADICEFVRAPVRQRCPALVEACAVAAPRLGNESGRSGQRTRRESNADGEGRNDNVRERTSFVLPGLFGTVLFWGTLAALVLALLRLLWPLFQSLRPVPEVLEKTNVSAPDPVDPAPRVVQESDVDRLLQRAEHARREGRFEQAVAALYGALVHFLGQEELITVEAARTNGDYLRELAGEPKLQASVRAAFRMVEGVQFGRKVPSAELCAELWDRVVPIVKRGVALVVLVLLPQALLGCGAYARSAPERGPNGLYLFTKLLQDGGTQVRHLIRISQAVDGDISQILVLGDDVSPEAWAMVLSWTKHGGALVATQPSRQLLRELHVDVEAALPCSHPLETGPSGSGAKLSVMGPGGRYLRLPSDASASNSSPPKEPWLRVDASCSGKPYAATFEYGDGLITLLPNRELLGNLSLSAADNAAFTLGLFGPPGGTLGIVSVWTGGGADSPIRALQNAGLNPVLLELLALAGLLLWHRGAAFGARRDPSNLSRRAFADHVRALGRNYERARASHHALAQYAAFTLEVLRERFGRGAPIGLIDLAGEVARRTGRGEAEVMQLLTEAHELAQSSGADVDVDVEPRRSLAPDLKTIDKFESLLKPSGGSQ